MPPSSPLTTTSFVEALVASGILTRPQQDQLRQEVPDPSAPAQPLARRLVDLGWLTPYQVNQFFQGRGRGLVIGPYLLLDRLGQGGTGVVFKARHQRMQRLVALKLIRPELLSDPEIVRRFYREIQAVGKLSHPHIVHPFDAGPVGEAHILVMEYIEGTDLDRLVKQAGPLPVGQACDYIRQAALGLHHAHERGMIHRDVKPANLLLLTPPPGSEWGTVKLVDLGLARLQSTAEGGLTGPLTANSPGMMGTPDYLAPEQALDFHEVDVRTDIYSLGCTLYYLLTGNPPFAGGTLTQKLMRHQQADPPPVTRNRPDVPTWVPVVLRHMMAKRPEDRYATAAHVAQALASADPRPPVPSSAITIQPSTLSDVAIGNTSIVLPDEASESDDPVYPVAPLAPGIASSRRVTRRRAIVLCGGGLLLTTGLLLGRNRLRGTSDAGSGPLTLQVAANQAWQDTLIDLPAGGEVTVAATGRWKKNSAPAECGPDGDPQLTHDWNLLPAAHAMCLVGREGPFGPPFTLGGGRTFVPKEGGRLFVQANDVELTGNTGTVSLSVEGGIHSSQSLSVPVSPLGEVAIPGNVALASRGARLTGPGGGLDELLDGVTTGYTGFKGFASGSWPCEWVVTFPRVYLLKEVRILLWDGNSRAYQYTVETSVDGKKFTLLTDRSKGQWRSWQTLAFDARPVKHIRLSGLHNTDNTGFHVVELEAYCFPPDKPVQPRFPSSP